MKISIITINYNNAKGLEKTIASVANQTFKEFEYIIIDGGSTDESVEIIKKYENHINYWVSEPDEGIYPAMNKGLAKASGKYCLFLNSGDSLYAENTLALLDERSCLGKEDIIYGDVYMENKDAPFIKSFPEFSLYTASYSPMPHQSSLISSQLLKELNGYDTSFKLLADRVFFIEAYLKNAKFRKLNLCVSKYDMTGISSTELSLFKQEEHRIRTEKFSFLAKEFEFFEDYHYYRNSRLFSVIKKFKIFINGLSKK